MRSPLKNIDTAQNRDHWNFVERTAKQVDDWPAWKRGDTPVYTRKEGEKSVEAAPQRASGPSE